MQFSLVNMPFSRRQALASGLAMGFATIAGCTSDCGFFGQRMSHTGTIVVSPIESVPTDATIIQFSQLSEPEQKLLRTAIEKGAVQICMDDEGEQTDSIYRFGNRAAGKESYLSHENEYYGLFVGITDQSYVMTAEDIDIPDGNPCC